MATNYEYDDEDDDFETESTDVVKQLRKVNRTLEKRLKDLEAEANSLKTQTRQRTVKDVLTAKNVNPKIAAFIPQDIEGEEAITTWLNEYGDVFGIQQEKEAAPESPDVTAQKRIANTINSAQAPQIDEDALAKILSAEGPAALNAILGIN
jgi:hypothetical protein